jgi:dimethylglycine dehydrogenase
MIHGEPEADTWPMDIARYGTFASNREYIRQTTGQFYSRRFVMTYPNEQLPAGRPLKKSPAYDAMDAAGALWGCSWGLEVPLMFGPPGFEETPTLKRSNAFEIVAEECRVVREQVGLLDISGFSRYEVTGKDAEAWLDRVMASRLPGPGRARLAPMVSPDGRLKGDLTLFNWGGGTWWIMGSYYLRQWHMRWFEAHIDPARDGDVSVRDISDAMVGFSISGPKARDVLASLTHQDVSHEALPFMGCATLDVGLVRAKVGRLSVVGELGYEINCHAAEHIALRETLLEAGAQHGIRECGYYALNSLRLEKSFGIWSKEFTQGYTPGMTGLDRWIDFNKGDFIGREAALREKEKNTAPQRLVTLEVDATDAEASGFEPVWQDGRRIGFVTSGGYGHSVGKSLAMALLEPELSEPGTELSAHIVGVERPARVIASSPHDPQGERLRA